MNIMLKDRIEILRSSGVIDDDVADYTNQIIDFLSAEKYEATKMEMFTTHLAMATQRMKRHESAGQMDDEIWKQIENSSNYDEAEQLADRFCQESPVKYTESERQFLIMHICNLMQKE